MQHKQKMAISNCKQFVSFNVFKNSSCKHEEFVHFDYMTLVHYSVVEVKGLFTSTTKKSRFQILPLLFTVT